MDGGLSSHLKRTPSSEWKKVRDGGRNAYAGSNLSSMRDIKRFFDTGGCVEGVGECLLGGGMVPISQNALCLMHN